MSTTKCVSVSSTQYSLSVCGNTFCCCQALDPEGIFWSAFFGISIYILMLIQIGRTVLEFAQTSGNDNRDMISILKKVKLDEDAHKNWTCA